MDRIAAILTCDMRLLMRSRPALVSVLLPSLLGGFFFGVAGRLLSGYLTPYGAFFTLPICAVFLALTPAVCRGLDDRLPLGYRPGRPVLLLSSLVYSAVLIGIQAVVYVMILLALDAGSGLKAQHIFAVWAGSSFLAMAIRSSRS